MHRTWLSVLTLMLLSTTTVAAERRPKSPPAAPPGTQVADSCAEVRASVRAEAYGYTHVVTLLNRCLRTVACELWTDVDPTPRVAVEVAAGASAEVVTRRGSPAREVIGYKKCSFR